jgi:hypothetical protein
MSRTQGGLSSPGKCMIMRWALTSSCVLLTSWPPLLASRSPSCISQDGADSHLPAPVSDVAACSSDVCQCLIQKMASQPPQRQVAAAHFTNTRGAAAVANQRAHVVCRTFSMPHARMLLLLELMPKLDNPLGGCCRLLIHRPLSQTAKLQLLMISCVGKTPDSPALTSPFKMLLKIYINLAAKVAAKFCSVFCQVSELSRLPRLPT